MDKKIEAQFESIRDILNNVVYHHCDYSSYAIMCDLLDDIELYIEDKVRWETSFHLAKPRLIENSIEHKYLCSVCEEPLLHLQEYCDECGIKIDWNSS